MYTSEKTDIVVWQVTETTGVPILGRVQAKPMNYISYLDTCTPRTVSSLARQSQVCRLCPQSTKTAQSMDSLETTPRTNQTAQEEHRATTKAKTSTTHQPKSAQVSLCKSSVTINGKTHPLPTK